MLIDFLHRIFRRFYSLWQPAHQDVICYSRHGKTYRVVFPQTAAAASVGAAHNVLYAATTNHDDPVDVTDHIRACSGPLANFHGIPLTPRDLGLEREIIVYDQNLNARVYAPDDRLDPVPVPGSLRD